MKQGKYAQTKKMQCGYDVITTFWTDFALAELYGEAGIRDTYNRAFKEWKDNVKYITELVIVLNDRCWHHYWAGDEKTSHLYADLYHKLNNWCYSNLKGDNLDYYFKTTD